MRGWTDIAYAAGVDLAGRVWDLRGLPYQVAANGSAQLNRTWSAVTLILGDRDAPSPAMIAAVQQWRARRFLPAFPRARQVVGHRDLWSTECPGVAAYLLVVAGTFEQLPPEEDEDMFVTFNAPGERPHEGQWVPAGAGRRCISRPELDARTSAGEHVVSRELPGDDPFWALPDVAAKPAPTKAAAKTSAKTTT